MGRRKKAKTLDAGAPVDPVTARRAEVLRRLLLGAVTAVIVARPVVLGEDPGLLTALSDTSNLLLSMTWLILAVGWAAWRALSRQASWRSSAVEFGLSGTVVAVFVSAAVAARYKHPAWLIAWEWLVLLVIFGLVRQLFRTPADNRGLLAAVLASAVSLSAYAIYQYSVELPWMRSHYGANPEDLRQDLAREKLTLESDSPQMDYVCRRLQENNAFATFAHPNTFAGYLALLIPVAVYGTLLVWRRQTSTRGFVALATLLLLAGLWLTHSRGAVVGSLMVGATALGWTVRQSLWRHRLGVGIVLAFLVATAVVVKTTETAGSGLAKAGRSFALRIDYWNATWRMIQDHPWLGVGPGNFSRYYPRYMLPTAYEKIQDPHNFLLETWATCGLFALLALLATLAAFFRKMMSGGVESGEWGVGSDKWCEPSSPLPTPYSLLPTPHSPLRWEFYLGGMAGLLLGFLLRTPGLSGDEILIEGVISGVRALIWFAAFALFDGIEWPGSGVALAGTAGVIALLLNWLVSGGLFASSLAQIFIVMLALVLNERSPITPEVPAAGHWLRRVVPFPLMAAVALLYFLTVFQPVTSAAYYLQEARSNAAHWPQVLQDLKKSDSERDRAALSLRAHSILESYVLSKIRLAALDDPGNATPPAELAYWYGEAWKLQPQNLELSKDAVKRAVWAQGLDPEGTEGYFAEYRLRKLFAAESKTTAQKQEQYGYAAAALRQVVKRDPTEARLHYELAEIMFEAGERVQGRHEAEEALRLDQIATEPGRRLTDPQREQVRKWIASPT